MLYREGARSLNWTFHRIRLIVLTALTTTLQGPIRADVCGAGLGVPVVPRHKFPTLYMMNGGDLCGLATTHITRTGNMASEMCD